jgi:hypothetical protein
MIYTTARLIETYTLLLMRFGQPHLFPCVKVIAGDVLKQITYEKLLCNTQQVGEEIARLSCTCR